MKRNLRSGENSSLLVNILYCLCWEHVFSPFSSAVSILFTKILNHMLNGNHNIAAEPHFQSRTWGLQRLCEVALLGSCSFELSSFETEFQLNYLRPHLILSCCVLPQYYDFHVALWNCLKVFKVQLLCVGQNVSSLSSCIRLRSKTF